MLEDGKIIDLYFQRNERALVETSDKYGNYCRSIAMAVLQDEETSKECLNDTLYQSWKAIPPKRPNCLKTFLGKITRNLSLKRWDREHTLKRGGGEVALALDELSECVADRRARGEEQITENMVIREVLNKFLAGLTLQNQRIFLRRYWYCSSVKEIAVALDLSEGNVLTSLSRSRGKLRESLEKAGVVL